MSANEAIAFMLGTDLLFFTNVPTLALFIVIVFLIEKYIPSQ